MRRNLVIVRAGDESLHTSYLGQESERSWDIIVSCYGKNPDLYRDRGQERVDDPRLANPSVYALILQRYQQWAGRYDYIWFCCDDIISDVARVNRMFDICRAHDLELAQPALTLDSRIGHPITAVNKAFILRHTTYVESMNPCFSYPFLLKCWPTYGMNITGYGIDYLWPEWVGHLSKIAIIDATPVKHTRSRGSLYEGFQQSGVVPEDDLKNLLNREKVWPLQMTTGGIDLRGRLHAMWEGGHRALIQALMAGYLPELANHPDLIYRAIEPIFTLLGQSDFRTMAELKAKLKPLINPPGAA